MLACCMEYYSITHHTQLSRLDMTEVVGLIVTYSGDSSNVIDYD